MLNLGSHRAMAIVLALAALAFTASGVPDNKGTDAAIGWFAFLALALAFLALTGASVVRRLRERGTAPSPMSPSRRRDRRRSHEAALIAGRRRRGGHRRLRRPRPRRRRPA